jgi:hypothetical protein
MDFLACSFLISNLFRLLVQCWLISALSHLQVFLLLALFGNPGLILLLVVLLACHKRRCRPLLSRFKLLNWCLLQRSKNLGFPSLLPVYFTLCPLLLTEISTVLVRILVKQSLRWMCVVSRLRSVISRIVSIVL